MCSLEMCRQSCACHCALACVLSAQLPKTQNFIFRINAVSTWGSLSRHCTLTGSDETTNHLVIHMHLSNMRIAQVILKPTGWPLWTGDRYIVLQMWDWIRYQTRVLSPEIDNRCRTKYWKGGMRHKYCEMLSNMLQYNYHAWYCTHIYYSRVGTRKI